MFPESASPDSEPAERRITLCAHGTDVDTEREDGPLSKNIEGIKVSVAPSGTGCADCLATPDGWWLHLRRCAECGHIGCCDNSPSQHATAHFHTTHHPIIASFEPGEDWFYDYRTKAFINGPRLAPPDAHPATQTVPGPANRVPDDWQSRLN